MTYNFREPVLGAFQVYDLNGAAMGLAVSQTSASFLPGVAGWSALSYIAGNQAWHAGNLSGLSTDYFKAEVVFDASLNKMLAVFSNNTDSFKFFGVEGSSTTFSDFTWPDSIDSTSASKGLASINDRLFLFNTLSSTGTRYPTRAMWSARGSPRNFLIASGAGAEDLMDMKGEGTGVIRYRDFLLLFTELEIWRATPTFDDYAFRFDRVIDATGTRWVNTIATTPQGVIWLDHDYEVYVTDGYGVRALGPIDGQGPSRIQRKLQDEMLSPSRAWGLYNHTKNRYELYYTASDSPGGYPSRALFYDFADQTWWPQRFPFGLSVGADLLDVATFVSWDDVADSWDATTAAWDDFDVAQGNRRVNVFESNGTNLRFFSAQTSDAGTAIDVRWRSGGLGAGTRAVHLKEIWVEHETNSASSVSVWVGDARRGDSFGSPVASSLSTSNDMQFIPTWLTDRRPAFELRLNDGGQPRIASFYATLQDASRFHR